MKILHENLQSLSPFPKSLILCLSACTVHCSYLLGVTFFLYQNFVCFLGFEFAQMFCVFFFLCVLGVWRSSWLWIQHPVTAKNRLTFNRPTHLVTNRSTIREPWKTRMNMWQLQERLEYPSWFCRRSDQVLQEQAIISRVECFAKAF